MLTVMNLQITSPRTFGGFACVIKKFSKINIFVLTKYEYINFLRSGDKIAVVVNGCPHFRDFQGPKSWSDSKTAV